MDFCVASMNSRIETSTASADGHPVKNLLSPAISDRLNGFLCESFVRPPVEIDVTFDLPINIHNVFFKNFVSNKRSTGIQVFVMPQVTTDSSFVLVSSCHTDHKDLVHLSNPRYGRWHKFPEALKESRQSLLPFTHEGFMKSRDSGHALENVTCLRLRIFKKASTGGFGIAGLEVWGEPGTAATTEQKQAATNNWHSQYLHNYHHNNQLRQENFYQEIFQTNEPVLDNTIPNSSITRLPPPVPDITNDVDIPSEFLDLLTCELMVTPMMLPSGHNVDASTLDKFISAERIYNRLPSDPFTGVLFSPTSAPTPNVLLKARIDRFVTLNQRDPALCAIGRSLLPAPTLPWAPLPTSKPPQQAGNSAPSPSVAAASPMATKRLTRSIEADSFRKMIHPSHNDADAIGKNDRYGKRKALCDSADSITSTAADNSLRFGGVRGLPSVVLAPKKRSFGPVKKPASSSSSSLSCSSTEPLSRGLLNQKPPKLIQGEGSRQQYDLYSSDSLLRSHDKCSSCSGPQPVYILEVCSHVLCRPCFQALKQSTKEGVSSVTCSVCKVDVHKKSIARYHSKSVFCS